MNKTCVGHQICNDVYINIYICTYILSDTMVLACAFHNNLYRVIISNVLLLYIRYVLLYILYSIKLIKLFPILKSSPDNSCRF